MAVMASPASMAPSAAHHSLSAAAPLPSPLSLPLTHPPPPDLVFDPYDTELIILSDDDEDDADVAMALNGRASTAPSPSSGLPSPSSESPASSSDSETETETEDEGAVGDGGGEASTQENRDLLEEDFHASQHQLEAELHAHNADTTAASTSPSETIYVTVSAVPHSNTGGGKRSHEEVSKADLSEPAEKRQRGESPPPAQPVTTKVAALNEVMDNLLADVDARAAAASQRRLSSPRLDGQLSVDTASSTAFIAPCPISPSFAPGPHAASTPLPAALQIQMHPSMRLVPTQSARPARPAPLPRLLKTAAFPLARKQNVLITLSTTPFRTLLAAEPQPERRPIRRPLTSKDLRKMCAVQLDVRVDEINEEVADLDEAMAKDVRGGQDLAVEYERRSDSLIEQMDAIEQELEDRKLKERELRRKEKKAWRKYNGPPAEGEEEEEEEEDDDSDNSDDGSEDDGAMEVDPGEESPVHAAAEESKDAAFSGKEPDAVSYFNVIDEMVSTYQMNEAEFKQVTMEAARGSKFTSISLFQPGPVEAGRDKSTHRRVSPLSEETDVKEGHAKLTLVEERSVASPPSDDAKTPPISSPSPAAVNAPPSQPPASPPPSSPAPSINVSVSPTVKTSSPSLPVATSPVPPPALFANSASPPRSSPPKSAALAAAGNTLITSFLQPSRPRVPLGAVSSSSSSASSSPPPPHPPPVRMRERRVEPTSPPAGGVILHSVIDLTDD